MERDLNTSNAVGLQTKIDELVEELETVKEELEASKSEVERVTKKRNEYQEKVTALTKETDEIRDAAARGLITATELSRERDNLQKTKEELRSVQSKLDKLQSDASKQSKEAEEVNFALL